MNARYISLLAGIIAIALANYLALLSPVSPLSTLTIPLLTEIFGNYWLDTFLVVLAAEGVVVIFGLWWEHRGKMKVEIKEEAIGDRLGFKITVKGAPLHSPEVTQTQVVFQDITSAEAYRLPLFDVHGNPLGRDYVLADSAFCVFPFIAKYKWETSEGNSRLHVAILEVPNNNVRAELVFDGLTEDMSFGLLTTNENPRNWDITLGIQAKEWSAAEHHVYKIWLSVLLFNPSAPEWLSGGFRSEGSQRKFNPEVLHISYRPRIEEVKLP